MGLLVNQNPLFSFEKMENFVKVEQTVREAFCFFHDDTDRLSRAFVTTDRLVIRN